MFWSDAREDCYLVGEIREFIFRDLRELSTGYRTQFSLSVLCSLEAQFARDRRCSDGVIAGDHLDFDSCILAFGDGEFGFLPGRIHHSQKTQVAQFLHLFVGEASLAGIESPPRYDEHSQTVRRQSFDGAVYRL